MIRIKRGLDLPISGAPEQNIDPARPVSQVAVLGTDYVGMKPTMRVQEGDRVRLGQALFEDKKTEGVLFTAPATGTVRSINRGAKRALQSVVIDVDADAEAAGDVETFETLGPDRVAAADADEVQALLVATGLWTALRTRPFSCTPELGSRPRSIFVTAIDTQPLAADPVKTIAGHREAFAHGLDVLARLTDGPVFLCTAPDADVPTGSDARIRHETFSGPHPAGLVGTHIHFLDPVGPGRTVWSIGYQDVIAIGATLTSGRLFTDRTVALAGPPVKRPRLLRTRLGASLSELVDGEAAADGDLRLISGSVLMGHIGRGPFSFLGRYHQQLSVLGEDHEREMLHYIRPGVDKFSVFPVFLSRLLGRKRFDFGTSTNGSARAMVPIGTYESVMPLDILPTQLLRALLVGDLDNAIALGCLELDEDDLALCTFACPGKYEYGPVLRATLNRIQKEG